MRLLISYTLLVIIIFDTARPVIAEIKKNDFSRMFTLYFENDAFFGTDYLYTNGIKLALTSTDLESSKDDGLLNSMAYSLSQRLPSIRGSNFTHAFSVAIGQNIYTPEDTENTELIENDRPYAGFTYFEMGLSGQDRGKMSSWELVLGIVGPHSYAEDTQKAVHEWNGWESPAGWDNQLKDEPVLNLLFTQRYKLAYETPGGKWGCDLIPIWGIGLGNLYTGAQAGTQLRFGWNLPEDFGTSLIRPGTDTNTMLGSDGRPASDRLRKFSLHLFIGVDSFYFLRNLTLDGNTYQESHSVDKEPLVTSFMVGLGIAVTRFKISFAHVYQTKEFKGQDDQLEFGSITFNYLY